MSNSAGEEYNNLIIQALTTIGNCESVRDACEPHVAEPMALKGWMVKRTLYALRLFEDEWERQTSKPTSKL